MKCMCLNKFEGIVKSNGTDMDKIGEPYYLSSNLYQKYVCPKCKKTKVKVLNGFTSIKRGLK